MKHITYIILLFVIVSANCSAADNEDEAPESDIGLSAEAIPEKDAPKIPELTFSPIESSPKIDGILDDPFWKQAKTFNLSLELYPTRLAPAPVDTKAWVGVSTTHIYIAFDANDPNPEKIRSALRERDASKEDDYVSVILDPTGNLAKKYEFRVNPHGTLSDVLQDTISERYIYDWDTEWEGAATRYEQGYRVEIAIPYGAIRTPADFAEENRKGVILLKRSYPRSVDRTLATFFYYKKHQTPTNNQEQVVSTKETEPTNKTKRKKLKLVPHYIYHKDEERDIGGEFKQVGEHSVHGAGLDLEYEIDSSKTVTLTINPNFTEVEADIARQSINNPFNVFKPEKRRFFKSSVEYYNSLIPTVYTRNIIQPRVGASYIQDDADNSFGGFTVDDKEVEVISPDNLGSDKITLLESSNSTAARYRYSKNKKTIGAIATYRSAEGYHNAVAGVDGLWDISPDDKLRYQLLYSDTKYPQRFAEDLCEDDDCTVVAPPVVCPLGSCSTNAQVLRTDYTRALTGHALQLRYKHDSPDAMYWVGYEDVAPDFRADLGFQRSVDIRSLNVAYGRKWYFETFADDEGKSRVRSYVIWTHKRSHNENERLEDAISLWGEFRGSYQSVLRVGKRINEKAVNRINQNSLATGANTPLFDEDYWQWYLETSPWSHITFNLDGRIGDIADADNLVLGDMLELKPKITVRFDKLQFTLSSTNRNFEVDGSRLYKEKFVSFTALYRANKQISHRLLFLNDLTQRDTNRWLGTELAEEIERTMEYTLTYKPNKKWSLLAGFKLEHEYESDIDDEDYTKQELYTKLEYTF